METKNMRIKEILEENNIDLNEMIEKQATKNIILKKMMELFFLYHDIHIDTINLDWNYGHTIYSKNQISPLINKKFHDKFELKDMELKSVIHCKDGNWEYHWEVPLSHTQKIMRIWTEMSVPILVPDIITYIPEKEEE